jgi:hypothetical protein
LACAPELRQTVKKRTCGSIEAAGSFFAVLRSLAQQSEQFCRWAQA